MRELRSTFPRLLWCAFLLPTLLAGMLTTCGHVSSPPSASAGRADASGDPASTADPTTGIDAARTVPLPEVDASRIALGHAAYRTTFASDGEVMAVTTRRELALTTAEGEPRVRVRQITEGTPGSAEDVVELAEDSLIPRRRTVTQPTAAAEIVYGRRQVTGRIRAGEKDFPVHVELQAPAFGDGTALETTVLALPLAPGYRTSLRSVEAGLMQRVRVWSLSVATGKETVEVPAGSFATFRVKLEPLDELGGGQTLWVSETPPRRLVQAETRLPPELGGNVTTTVLVSVEDADLQARSSSQTAPDPE